MKIIKYLFPFLFFLSLIASCDDDICTSETESFLEAEIVVLDAALIDLAFADSLSVYAPEWNDSIHYWENGNTNKYLFALSPSDSISRIIICSKNHDSKDTITIIHQNKLILLSPECGFIHNYTIDTFSFTENLIDSVFLQNDKLTTDKNGQIKIYL